MQKSEKCIATELFLCLQLHHLRRTGGEGGGVVGGEKLLVLLLDGFCAIRLTFSRILNNFFVINDSRYLGIKAVGFRGFLFN